MSDLVEVRREGRLARVALNRPEKRNALSVALCRELAEALEEADGDPGVGAILLSGNGKAFCAGMDLDEVLDADSGAIDVVHERVFTAGLRLNTPIVAAVHGAALAGGTGLAANCHVVVAADDATFGLTEIRLGLWPFVIFRVVEAAVGLRRATEMALTGRIFGAAEAERYGLVHRVVPAGELELAAQDAATEIAQASRTAVRGGLEYVRASRGLNMEEAGEIARRTREEVFRSAEFREGIRAFRDKHKAG
jgi:enoyl-CoA hydratase/carnithine racemase